MLEEGVGANSQQRPMLDGVNTSKKHLRKRDGHRTIRHSQDDHRVASASPAVRAVNALTTRWCAQLDGEDFALSGAGVWPLLVLLASAADEQARTELTAALEVPADQAMSDALELLDGLQEGGSIAAAMSIWVHKDIPLHKDWAAERPPGVVGELTDQATLDQWAADATKGLITRFPADITADTGTEA